MSDQSQPMIPSGPPLAKRTGFDLAPVLRDLWGKTWDDEVMWGYLHSLRPSSIEIVQQGAVTTCDWRDWRVRVFLGDESKRL